jgi:hypothetical protein
MVLFLYRETVQLSASACEGKENQKYLGCVFSAFIRTDAIQNPHNHAVLAPEISHKISILISQVYLHTKIHKKGQRAIH